MSFSRLVVFFLSASCTLIAGPLSAQQAQPKYAQSFPTSRYLTKDPKDGLDQQRQDERAAYNIFRLDAAVNLVNSQTDLLKSYYGGFKFRELTLLEKLPELPALRDDLLTDIKRIRNRQAHDLLVAMTFQWMSRVTTLNCHPAVRFNAMVILGELNQVELGSGTNARPPIPHAQALQFMLAQLANPQQIDAVRLAALRGIRRQMHLYRFPRVDNLPDAEQTKIKNAMFAIISGRDPGAAARSQDGKIWFQRLAIEVLGEMGNAGGNVARGLMSLASSSTQPPSIRFAAASALGDLNYTPQDALDPKTTAARLMMLASDAIQEEVGFVEQVVLREDELAKKLADSGGGGLGFNQFGGAGMDGDEQPLPKYLANATRSRLTWRLTCVRKAMKGPPDPNARRSAATDWPKRGVVALADDQAKKDIAPMLETLDKIISETSDSDLNLRTVAPGLRMRAREMEALANKSLPQRAPAQPRPAAAVPGPAAPGPAAAVPGPAAAVPGPAVPAGS